MLKIIDKHFWIIYSAIIIVIISSSLGLGSVEKIYCWFFDIVYNDNTNLVTISTVFIGIYFSLYSTLTTSNSSSFVSKLSFKEIKKLAAMVNIGFLSSFIIVLTSFVNVIFYSLFNIFYIVFLFIVCFFLWGSAIQVALYYTFLFRNDINNKYNSIQKEERNEVLDNELRKKLKQFLDREL